MVYSVTKTAAWQRALAMGGRICFRPGQRHDHVEEHRTAAYYASSCDYSKASFAEHGHQ